ncbi:hypothetical protein EV401DRAFT_225444 [Pisolithus croceorrhizus]|nr:hypothetical protein EV401DRAFT_225444 [Pisolithus croceorrhizus]
MQTCTLQYHWPAVVLEKPASNDLPLIESFNFSTKFSCAFVSDIVEELGDLVVRASLSQNIYATMWGMIVFFGEDAGFEERWVLVVANGWVVFLSVGYYLCWTRSSNPWYREYVMSSQSQGQIFRRLAITYPPKDRETTQHKGGSQLLITLASLPQRPSGLPLVVTETIHPDVAGYECSAACEPLHQTKQQMIAVTRDRLDSIWLWQTCMDLVCMASVDHPIAYVILEGFFAVGLMQVMFVHTYPAAP